MEIVKLKIKDLQTNIGQIPDLPMNPREWTQADVDRLAASLRETPELFEARPVLVVPQGKKYVILGGNMRYEASKKNGESEIPAIIFPADTPTAKLKELVIKDNGNFGNWSFDALANEGDDLPLTDWGVPAWQPEEEINPEDYGEQFNLPDGERTGFRQVSFQLSDEMAEVVLFATKAAHYTEEFYSLEGDEEDKNGNGVAVYLMAKWWLDMLAKEPGVDYEKAKAEAEELRQYLRDALAKSGHKAKDVDEALGTNGMSGHYFGESQWMFPTKKAYKIMREFMPLERDFLECKSIELRYNLLKTLETLKTQWEGQKK